MTSQKTTEMTDCLNCHVGLDSSEQHRYVCVPCEQQVASRLAELPQLYSDLKDCLQPAQRGNDGIRVSMTKKLTAPVPFNIDVMSMLHGEFYDALAIWEDDWRIVLNWETRPVDSDILQFLKNNLLWAVEDYQYIKEFIEGIEQLYTRCLLLTGKARPRNTSQIVGNCPAKLSQTRCDKPLRAYFNKAVIKCSCGASWQFQEWYDLATLIKTADKQ